ncbi:anti-sigma factor family protein [Streptomyces sp. NPDC050560]|uniref:anti-sigma factor family protein n=1 Tax=Streptomyces sp. NPDC050560 TaxID=3365630 RepID=UPI0037B101F3
MTSMTDGAGHPDEDELSSLAEGLLPEPRATELHRHVAHCADCGGAYAALEEIRALLGSLPPAPPMPDDVIARLDLALAAEASRSAATDTAATAETAAEAETAAGPGTAAEADATAEAETAAETEAAAAAAAAPAASVGGHVSRETFTPGGASRPDRPAGHPRAATRHPRAAKGPGRGDRGRAGRRRTRALGAVFTAAVIGLGSLLLQSLADDGRDGGTEASSMAPSPSSETFSSDRLETQIGSLLTAQPSTENTGPSLDSGPVATAPSLDMASPEHEPAGESPLKDSAPAVRVPDCVQEGIGRVEPPLAAERGTFEGVDAFLVVLPHATDSSRVSAYIVDASCTRESFAHPGQILLTGSYARR